MFEVINDKYNSPRITGEVLDCSMPMTFDQYSNCGYGCMYCFSTFQRAINQGAENYLQKKVKKVNVERIKELFMDTDNPKNPFRNLIKNRITLQWGGLSDPFCPIEEQEGVGYELLKFFKEINYPLCFSSKSDLLLRDEKYLKLFEGQKNWSYKATIITDNADHAKILEAGAPSPQRRLEVLKTLSSMGIWTIIRVRPFIIGVSNLTYERLINTAADFGVKALSTEFFCIEERTKNIAKVKYATISKITGFDILQFYKNISPGCGYLRLNYEIKKPYIEKMQEICAARGMSFHVSDAHHKEKGCSGSCCGLPQDESVSKFSKCQFTNALQIAKQNGGKVSWSDIAKYDCWLKDMDWTKAPGYNTGTNVKRFKNRGLTMFEYMRNKWNDPNCAVSPYKYFQGILKPIGVDENNDVIYQLIDK